MSEQNIVRGMNSCNSASENEPTERYVKERAEYQTFRPDRMKNCLTTNSKTKENEDIRFCTAKLCLLVRLVVLI